MKTRALATALFVTVACSADREEPKLAPVYDADVAPILSASCARCHDGERPAGGYRVGSYLDAIGCDDKDVPTTIPADDRAPILRALSDATHAGVVSESDAATLRGWVEAKTPAFRNGVHAPGIVDPRSSDFHGAMLRAARWRPMLDAADPNACGRCHDGVPAKTGVTSFAPGATSCTTCHDRPGGALACGTCHGDGDRSAPPRDACFFPGDSKNAGAHAAHIDPSEAKPSGLACSTCHPTPSSDDVISGLHGDGAVEIVFDAKVVGDERSFDASTETCAVSCHDQGGARPRPRWSETQMMGCGDCHGAPPANHFPGKCSTCHVEANASGTALTGGDLHMNGKVDLGNGDGTCGACHGENGSPWPKTGAHAAHRDPTLTTPVDCSTCHVVPTSVFSKGHLDGQVAIVFSGRAKDRGAEPYVEGKSCVDVACHGANLVDPPAVVPSWFDTSGAASKCGACHGIPPTQHTSSTSCGASNCHGAEVMSDDKGNPFITSGGKKLHIDGAIEPAL